MLKVGRGTSEGRAISHPRVASALSFKECAPVRLDARTLEGIRRALCQHLDKLAQIAGGGAFELIVEPAGFLDYHATLLVPEIKPGEWDIDWESITCPCCLSHDLFGDCGRFIVKRV